MLFSKVLDFCGQLIPHHVSLESGMAKVWRSGCFASLFFVLAVQSCHLLLDLCIQHLQVRHVHIVHASELFVRHVGEVPVVEINIVLQI